MRVLGKQRILTFRRRSRAKASNRTFRYTIASLRDSDHDKPWHGWRDIGLGLWWTSYFALPIMKCPGYCTYISDEEWDEKESIITIFLSKQRRRRVKSKINLSSSWQFTAHVSLASSKQLFSGWKSLRRVEMEKKKISENHVAMSLFCFQMNHSTTLSSLAQHGRACQRAGTVSTSRWALLGRRAIGEERGNGGKMGEMEKQ